MPRSTVAALVAFCVFGFNAKAEVFYWKALNSSFADPANWDAGSDGAGNANRLIPGESDEIFGARAATWDLGGETRTIAKWDSLLDLSGAVDWGRYVIELKNGTLNVKQRISHNDTINVRGGATLQFTEGSLYVPSQNCGGAEFVTVDANARFVVKGRFSPYRISLTTARYGETVIDPELFKIETGSSQTNLITNLGTNIFPNGLVWTGSGTAACTLGINLKWSGRLLAAGLFDRNDHPGKFFIDIEGSGSVVESLGDLSFAGVDECHVRNGMTFTANEGHCIDASNFSYYKHTQDNNGNHISSYKLGSGTLAIGADLPPRFQVNAGTIAVRARRDDLAGMIFAGSGITVRYDVPGCRLDMIENEAELSRVTFTSGIDLSSLEAGVTLFSSSNPAIRGAMNTSLSASLPSGFTIYDNGDSLFLKNNADVMFDSSKSDDLSDGSAWSTGEVPDVGNAVVLGGGGTVVLNASSPKFAKITVCEGSVLRIEGGSDADPVVPPPLVMRYAGKILCVDGSCVRLEQEIESLPLPTSLPVFEIATNAVVYPVVPNQETKGFSFKNLHLNYFGTIVLPDATRLQTPCVTFGAADAETAYFGMNVDGGRLIVNNTVSGWQGNASLLRIMCPENGGKVHPVGEFTLRNFTKGPNSYGSGNDQILANSGYSIGVANPNDIAFTVNVSGTPIALNGTTIIAGGANIVCSGPDSGLVKGDEFINYTLTQYVSVEGAACITLKDGARFSNAFCVGSEGRVYFRPDALGHRAVVCDGGIMELYQVNGNGNAAVLMEDSCWDVGRLIPEETKKPETGWVGAEYASVLYGFRTIELAGLLQVRGTDAFPRPAWWEFDGYWDHEVEFADMPVSGTGSILVTNTTANNSMTLTMVNRGNQATGTIAAAPGTRSRLLFKDDAKWNGTVIANGCAGLVNTDAATGVEKAAFVKFKNMRMDGEFPIRVWNTDAARTNDFIEISGSITGSEGGFCGVPMDGRSPKAGDSYRFATYPASAELPVNAVPRWRLSSVPHGNSDKVVLVLTYQPPGTTIVLR